MTAWEKWMLDMSRKLRDRRDYRTSSGACSCPICRLLDSEPVIVKNVYTEIVRETWKT